MRPQHLAPSWAVSNPTAVDLHLFHSPTHLSSAGNSGQDSTSTVLPVSTDATTAMDDIYCCHDDCLESLETFSSAAALGRHMQTAHPHAGAKLLEAAQPTVSMELDHLVYFMPGPLSGAIKWFSELTGVTPIVGGRHIGLGTHNAVFSLNCGSYFEIICIDPEQSSVWDEG